MRYENAVELLPPELLEQVQNYVSGALLYIPAREERKPREDSSYRQWIKKRNQIIVNGFRYGESIRQLAEDHFLSEETVRKIVYSRKNGETLVFRPVLSSAEEYREAGLLEVWAYTYMAFERCHRKFADALYRSEQHYFGPITLPTALVHRNTGPEREMRWRISREVFERETGRWLRRLEESTALPPMLIGYEDERFVVNCHNPMLEALRRRNIAEFPFIVRTDAEGLPVLQKVHPEICRV